MKIVTSLISSNFAILVSEEFLQPCINVSISMSDINECLDDTHNCHANAGCGNTVGWYACTCDDGYSGDGEACTGRSVQQ